MNSSFIYKLIAKVYDILDLSYFRKQSTSPRKAVNELVGDSNVKVLDICTGTAANVFKIR